ncbi:TPA: hypothetical protein ACS2XB_003057 [Legionella pneumophila]|nr:hypothetical protein [Legionella pneumophila]MCK1859567.1 hypothetical protein [Legionella pneumophila]HDV5714073.1 hypothetical protein [Legionella pneumophila]HDV5941471.1 hypothetical protein [Legionella pneumophila]HEL9698473.1 hypothetical protein [Legionella pneumophila]HEO1456162.1 hypothetical protein [Legionella pneumophila]
MNSFSVNPGYAINQLLLDEQLEIDSKINQFFLTIEKIFALNTKSDLFQLLVNNDEAMVQAIVAQIECEDHIGFLFPAETNLAFLCSCALKLDFTDCQIFPSVLVAKELGVLLHQDFVRTFIFKANKTRKDGRTIGVEIFIPKADPKIVKSWIAEGLINHVAFRVKSYANLKLIYNIFRNNSVHKSKSVYNQIQRNKYEESSFLFYDHSNDGHTVRIEFVSYN